MNILLILRFEKISLKNKIMILLIKIYVKFLSKSLSKRMQ